MHVLKRGRLVFDIEIQSLLALRHKLNKNFTRSVVVLQTALKKRNKVALLGVGKSGLIGQKIAGTLNSTAAPAIVLDPVNAAHGDLGILHSGDVVLALSYSGETEELLRILPSLRRLKVDLIAITGHPRSTLAREADIHLDVSVPKEACPLELCPTSSTTAMIVLGDALAMALLEIRGFKKEDFARYHPGGTLGQSLLCRVRDVMRPLESIALCRPNDKVNTVLAAMTAKRCGAAIIAPKGGKLAGIYTHGDFVREYQRNRDIGDTPVRKVMTRNPISVQAEQLAVEVLNTLDQHQVDDIVAVDSRNRPVGLVDTQDLTKKQLL